MICFPSRACWSATVSGSLVGAASVILNQAVGGCPLRLPVCILVAFALGPPVRGFDAILQRRFSNSNFRVKKNFAQTFLNGNSLRDPLWIYGVRAHGPSSAKFTASGQLIAY